MDKILGAQEVEAGGFKAHDIPSGLILHPRIGEADNPLRAAQQQQCTLGLLLAKGMSNLDDIVLKLKEAISQGHGLSLEETKDLATELSDEATRPLGQAFRLVASKTNDIHIKRKEKLCDGVKGQDEVLAAAIKKASLGHQTFSSRICLITSRRPLTGLRGAP